ncbi:ubinuclein-2-like [Calypte anna]|uniref:ubinuclein-2-like n=1 Tax=Calypte anna TaxID=9244 RepID=UPI0011C384CC|nr:ubinuclein-2-like [Calypte anna]
MLRVRAPGAAEGLRGEPAAAHACGGYPSGECWCNENRQEVRAKPLSSADPPGRTAGINHRAGPSPTPGSASEPTHRPKPQKQPDPASSRLIPPHPASSRLIPPPSAPRRTGRLHDTVGKEREARFTVLP